MRPSRPPKRRRPPRPPVPRLPLKRRRSPFRGRSPRRRRNRSDRTRRLHLLRRRGDDRGVGHPRGHPPEYPLRGRGAPVLLRRRGGALCPSFRGFPRRHPDPGLRGRHPRPAAVRRLPVEPDLRRERHQPDAFPPSRRGDLPGPVRHALVRRRVDLLRREEGGLSPHHRGHRRTSDDPLPSPLRGRVGAAAGGAHRRGVPVPARPRDPGGGRHAGGDGMTLDKLLIIAAALFCCGLYTVMTRRNAVAVLMGVELILNATNINFVAFSFFLSRVMGGQIFAVFVIVLAAAEAAVALAIFLRMFSTTGTVEVDAADELKG